MQKGLRVRNSPTCTLSQNGYGDEVAQISERARVNGFAEPFVHTRAQGWWLNAFAGLVAAAAAAAAGAATKFRHRDSNPGRSGESRVS